MDWNIRDTSLSAHLRSDTGADLLTPYRSGEEQTVARLIRETIINKATPSITWPTRSMATIGG